MLLYFIAGLDYAKKTSVVRNGDISFPRAKILVYKKNVVTKLALLRGKLDSSGYYLSGNTENRKICHQNKTKILENFLPSFLKSRGHGCSDFGMKRGKDY